jgi:membrane associated rhomboid family serine protease
MGYDAGGAGRLRLHVRRDPGRAHGQRGGGRGGGAGVRRVRGAAHRSDAVLTSMFLHGSWLHLIGQHVVPVAVREQRGGFHGALAVPGVLPADGVLAAAAHIFSAPDSLVPMVGASGAISGVMGAYLLLYPRIRIQTLFIFVIILRIIPVPAWFVLILWFGLQLLSGYTDPMVRRGVAVWAHVGGFVAGVLLVKVFENRRLGGAAPRTAERRSRHGGWRTARGGAITSTWRSRDEAVPPIGPGALAGGRRAAVAGSTRRASRRGAAADRPQRRPDSSRRPAAAPGCRASDSAAVQPSGPPATGVGGAVAPIDPAAARRQTARRAARAPHPTPTGHAAPPAPGRCAA